VNRAHALLLSFSLAFGAAIPAVSNAAATAPANYGDDDLRVPSPGADWKMRDAVRGMPALRVMFSKNRGPGATSEILVLVEPRPVTNDPADYLRRIAAALVKAPISQRIVEKKAFTWHGRSAFQLLLEDKAGHRFARVAFLTPKGEMLMATIQSPSASSWKEDTSLFHTVVDGIEMKGAKK